MNLKKKILKSKFFIGAVAYLVCFYIWLVRYSSRWQVINHDVQNAHKKQQVIFAFWHGRLLMIPAFAVKNRKTNVLISNHSDGALIAKVQHIFGFKTIRGSTSKGAVKALKQIISAKQKGENIAITPDGPRGPAQKVGGNVAQIAKMLELPIIPVTYSFRNARQAGSWDSFMIPHPFGRGVLVIGKPIAFENAHTLEDELNKLTKEADFAANAI
jgi:lysophospholipid acyltransferase (LPLAT)-like uncharacterized protein